MVNQNWKLELEKVILLSVFGNSKSKQTKNNIGKPEHFQDTKFRIRNWMDLFPCVANALAQILLTCKSLIGQCDCCQILQPIAEYDFFVAFL